MSTYDELKGLLQEFKKEIIKEVAEKINTCNTVPRTHLKTKEAMDFFACSRNTLDAISIKYKFKPVKVAGVNYYKIEDLERVLQSG